jgi:enoyl-CoA hydratase
LTSGSSVTVKAVYSTVVCVWSGRPRDDRLRIETQCFNRSIVRSIVASETHKGLRQFNERDYPDRRADTVPVTPGLSRSAG